MIFYIARTEDPMPVPTSSYRITYIPLPAPVSGWPRRPRTPNAIAATGGQERETSVVCAAEHPRPPPMSSDAHRAYLPALYDSSAWKQTAGRIFPVPSSPAPSSSSSPPAYYYYDHLAPDILGPRCADSSSAMLLWKRALWRCLGTHLATAATIGRSVAHAHMLPVSLMLSCVLSPAVRPT
ncbi:unnamed protein product [Mycena citricolor]|uniref:Uncharacterized protein n=1 Tax=Mycena citricolor TaxID=2018698 RepID=A0AAD2H0A9_9AGAR|nr:unnamed protein product [Mycena citricolor]